MESEVNGKLPFLDTIVTKQADGLVTNVYKNQRIRTAACISTLITLLVQKLAVIDTLLARGKAISQTPVDYQEEVCHIKSPEKGRLFRKAHRTTRKETNGPTDG